MIENIIKRAHQDGAAMISKAKVVGMLHDEQGKINGVQVEDQLTKEQFAIHAKVVINTPLDPWSDIVRELDSNDNLPPQMRPTKGVHLVVDREKLESTSSQLILILARMMVGWFLWFLGRTRRILVRQIRITRAILPIRLLRKKTSIIFRDHQPSLSRSCDPTG